MYPGRQAIYVCTINVVMCRLHSNCYNVKLPGIDVIFYIVIVCSTSAVSARVHHIKNRINASLCYINHCSITLNCLQVREVILL